MNNFVRHSKLFLNRHGSTILTVAGRIGAVATTVMAVKATPKALKRMDEAKKEKGDELSKLEVVKVAGPVYVPSIVTGAATLACIFGANVLNKKQQASLMSAYALLDHSYKDYRAKVTELFGEDAEGKIQTELAKDAYDEDLEVEDGKQLFYESFSGRYFESTIGEVLRAEYDFNRKFAVSGYVCLNELYDEFRLDRADYGDELGWSRFEMGEMYMYEWIDFEHTPAEIDGGMECIIITMPYQPTYGFMEY